ncbi:hypothetical protein AQ860_30145 [Burkholderia pseudomallei]|nr:hypothetical protein AQ760_07375 [Burkholderia pseudomallei]OMZ22896.1 hypothetical protein AQ859_30920 [Burkholderia pseudomallei]OMZ38785.1 hypothetical protein AQ860_30145 [Burkholderia pseudomallei]
MGQQLDFCAGLRVVEFNYALPSQQCIAIDFAIADDGISQLELVELLEQFAGVFDLANDWVGWSHREDCNRFQLRIQATCE